MIPKRTGLALSIQQPWAWLIVNGYKNIENRDWLTHVRGVIGVHAGKKLDREAVEYVRNNFPLISLPATFDLGGVVGRTTITNCVTDSDSEWFFGKFGFVLCNSEPLPFMPCRGQLGFFRPAITAQRRHT